MLRGVTCRGLRSVGTRTRGEAAARANKYSLLDDNFVEKDHRYSRQFTGTVVESLERDNVMLTGSPTAGTPLSAPGREE